MFILGALLSLINSLTSRLTGKKQKPQSTKRIIKYPGTLSLREPSNITALTRISEQAHKPGRRASPPRWVRELLLQHTRHPKQLRLAPMVAHKLHRPRELSLLVVSDGQCDRRQTEQVGQEDVPHELHDQRDVVLPRLQRSRRDPRRQDAGGRPHNRRQPQLREELLRHIVEGPAPELYRGQGKGKGKGTGEG